MGSLCSANAKVQPGNEPPKLDLNSSCSSANPRHVLRGDQEPVSGGECIVYLEKATNVPLQDMVRALTCGCTSSKQNGLPFVKVWAEGEGGKKVGQPAVWPYKQSNDEPRWYSARSLGFVLDEHPTVTLILEIWDRSQNACLGSLRLPLQDAKGSSPVTKEVEVPLKSGLCSSAVPSKGTCTVTLQVLDSKAILQKRTVYFVRHGESIWNLAQANMDLYTMGRTTDHPLSAEGRLQGEGLKDRIAGAAKRQELWVQDFLTPDVVYVSPLTRAIQTAAIALEDVLTPKSNIVMTPNCREKQNFGGLDSQGKVFGPDVVQRAYDELIALYDNESNKAIENFSRLNFDLQEVEARWWLTKAEDKKTLESRMQEFMSQLIYSPHRTIIVVGHSHFPRALFKQYMSESFKSKKSMFAQEASVKKLCNCGVAKVELDPSASLETPITDIELVLETTWAVDAGFSKCTGCCQAGSVQVVPHSDPNEEVFVKEPAEKEPAKELERSGSPPMLS